MRMVGSKTRKENGSQIMKERDCLTQESRHDLENNGGNIERF